jgi:hypothetical protein
MLKDRRQLAGLQKPLNKYLTNLKQHSNQLQRHTGNSFLLLAIQQEIKLTDQMIIDQRGAS